MVNLRARHQTMSKVIKATAKRASAKTRTTEKVLPKVLDSVSQKWVGCNFIRSDGTRCPVKQLLFIPPDDILNSNMDQFMCGFCLPAMVHFQNSSNFAAFKFKPTNDLEQISQPTRLLPKVPQKNQTPNSDQPPSVPQVFLPPKLLTKKGVSTHIHSNELNPGVSPFRPEASNRQGMRDKPIVINDDNRRRHPNAGQLSNDHSDNVPIYPNHRRGTCLEINTTCAYRHPYKCWNMLRSGNCTRDDCTYYHGLLFCHNSLKNGRCFKKDCNYHHIKKTIRTPSPKHETPKVNPPTSVSPSTDTFLGLFQRINDRLSDIEKGRYQTPQPQYIAFQDPSIIKVGYQGQTSGVIPQATPYYVQPAPGQAYRTLGQNYAAQGGTDQERRS